jgi:hypothetical protein
VTFQLLPGQESLLAHPVTKAFGLGTDVRFYQAGALGDVMFVDTTSDRYDPRDVTSGDCFCIRVEEPEIIDGDEKTK